MYLIANATSSFVEIPDLGVSLKPKQAMDLHAMGYKGKAESSSDLSKAIKNGWVKVLKKDVPTKKTERIIETHTEKIIDNSINKEEMLINIRQIIKEEFKEEFKDIKKQNNNQSSEELISILSKFVNSNSLSNKNNAVSKEEDTDEDIGLEKLTEIHAKVANKAMKDVSSSLKYKEEEIKDNSMKDKISELEGLL